MLESKLQAKIIKTLKKIDGCYCVKYPGGPYGTKGTPDILGSLDGRMFAIEVKVGTNTASDAQEEQLRRWGLSNALQGVAWSVEDALRIVGVLE